MACVLWMCVQVNYIDLPSSSGKRIERHLSLNKAADLVRTMSQFVVKVRDASLVTALAHKRDDRF